MVILRELLSPKDVAQAIGVSESSVKRWADRGLLKASRTVGGHRRIPLSEAVRFIRERGAPVVKPEILGLPLGPPLGDDPAATLHSFLLKGRAAEVRGWLLSAYTAGTSLAELFDGPLREALEQIGTMWKDNGTGIFLEHRATEICQQAIHLMRLMFSPDEGAPAAIGGAIPGDRYLLPSLMATTVLLSEGYGAINLGPDTPYESLDQAVRQYTPRVVWISASVVKNPEGASKELAWLFRRYTQDGIICVLGGRQNERIRIPAMDGFHRAQRMAELVALAKGTRARD